MTLIFLNTLSAGIRSRPAIVASTAFMRLSRRAALVSAGAACAPAAEVIVMIAAVDHAAHASVVMRTCTSGTGPTIGNGR
jgi:hypothetical protein